MCKLGCNQSQNITQNEKGKQTFTKNIFDICHVVFISDKGERLFSPWPNDPEFFDP